MKTILLIIALSSTNPYTPRNTIQFVVPIIVKESLQVGLDPVLVSAVISLESRFMINVIRRGKKGHCDVGLGQIRVRNCDKEKVYKYLDPENNIKKIVKLISRRKYRCEIGDYPEKYCKPHFIQSYNPKRKGYADKILREKRKIEILMKKGFRNANWREKKNGFNSRGSG